MLQLLFVTTLVVCMAYGDVTIEPELQNSLKPGSDKPFNIIITMQSTEPVLAQIAQQSFLRSEDKLEALSTALEEHSTNTQGPVLDFLNQVSSNRSVSQFLRNEVTVRPFWISNQISVRGITSDTIASLATTFKKVIRKIDLEKNRQLLPLHPAPTALKEEKLCEYTWGVKRIQAPVAWALHGVNGVGVIIGQIDTGVRGTHEAVKAKFRGAYGWYDLKFCTEYC